MLKKIVIPSSIGLATIMIVAVMLSQPLDVAEKDNMGLSAPAMSVYEVTQLQEINASTPNKISGDLGPNEQRFSTEQPNREFAKYRDIAIHLDMPNMNVKILSNDDNSRSAILLSPGTITADTTDAQFLYKDNGIWISKTSLAGTSIEKGAYIKNLNPGFRVVDVNANQQAVIQSQGQVEQFGGVVDRMMVLRMITDTDAFTMRGFISDDQAIKIAGYLTKQ